MHNVFVNRSTHQGTSITRLLIRTSVLSVVASSSASLEGAPCLPDLSFQTSQQVLALREELLEGLHIWPCCSHPAGGDFESDNDKPDKQCYHNSAGIVESAAFDPLDLLCRGKKSACQDYTSFMIGSMACPNPGRLGQNYRKAEDAQKSTKHAAW